MVSGYEYDDERISKDMLEDIRDGGKSHPSVNRRDGSKKYVVALNKDYWNRRERYYLCKTRV